MTDRRMVNQITKRKVHLLLRAFALVAAFLVALDACIAINRWWLTAGFQAYMWNLVVMTGGFTVFTALASRSRTELVGYILLCVAVYSICNYEIGGPSKYYLTPFDPAFGLPQLFPKGQPPLPGYRRTMAYITAILAASVLAFAKMKRQT